MNWMSFILLTAGVAHWRHQNYVGTTRSIHHQLFIVLCQSCFQPGGILIIVFTEAHDWNCNHDRLFHSGVEAPLASLPTSDQEEAVIVPLYSTLEKHGWPAQVEKSPQCPLGAVTMMSYVEKEAGWTPVIGLALPKTSHTRSRTATQCPRSSLTMRKIGLYISCRFYYIDKQQKHLHFFFCFFYYTDVTTC